MGSDRPEGEEEGGRPRDNPGSEPRALTNLADLEYQWQDQRDDQVGQGQSTGLETLKPRVLILAGSEEGDRRAEAISRASGKDGHEVWEPFEVKILSVTRMGDQLSEAPDLISNCAAVVVVRTLRDDVALLEAYGFCVGKLDPDRVFVVGEPQVRAKMVQPNQKYDYGGQSGEAFEDWVSQVAEVLVGQISKEASKMSWTVFIESTRRLHENVINAAHSHFRPDAIIGVGAGGTIVAGILHYFSMRSQTPFVCVAPKVLPEEAYEAAINSLAAQILPSAEKRKRQVKLLVVDTSIQSGSSLVNTIEMLKEAFVYKLTTEGEGWKKKEIAPDIRTAVLLDLREWSAAENEGPIEVEGLIHADSTWFRGFPYG